MHYGIGHPRQTLPWQIPAGQTPTPDRHPPGQTPPGQMPPGRYPLADTPRQTPPGRHPPGRHPTWMVNEWVVCIPLEWILGLMLMSLTEHSGLLEISSFRHFRVPVVDCDCADHGCWKWLF